jgi:hypothetical protein
VDLNILIAQSAPGDNAAVEYLKNLKILALLNPLEETNAAVEY